MVRQIGLQQAICYIKGDGFRATPVMAVNKQPFLPTNTNLHIKAKNRKTPVEL